MKELNLEVGQKVWSIQLGDCVVDKIYENTEFPYAIINSNGIRAIYHESKKYLKSDVCQSIFESNPFEPKLVQENEQKENKAELINALFNIANVDWDTKGGLVKMAREKLHKLLESL